MTLTHLKLNKAHLLALIGNIATIVCTIVPQWSGREQVIVAALGGVVSNTYPLVNAVHRAIDVIKDLVENLPNVAQLKSDLLNFAQQAVGNEAGKLDLNGMAQDAVAAVQTGNLNALTEEEIAKLKAFVSNLASPHQAPSSSSLVPPIQTS